MSDGLERLSAEQRNQLDTEVAMIQSALESMAESGVAELEPIYRLLLSMADSQIRLGLGAVLAICAMQDRLGGTG